MKTEDEFKAEVQALLDQFGQAILYGPPGTGKTRLARGVAAKILRLASTDKLEGEKERFQFVQFHPSYNYEDFVRGIRMETDDNGRVAYKTENRVFGEMAERALANKGEPHVLVIDEINRANVSAVLGELIYGLEMGYRGKEVQTPYEVDGGYGLTVPSNLKVIGTMNTADRTIGQIDYAVRRRFAFVQCLPEPSVVADARAKEFFEMVDGVFVHLSADHDKEDVCIGHSYFLASGPELANKIIYQVVPILREYLKDGVLGKEAKPAIDKIEEEARKLGKSGRGVESVMPVQADALPEFWRWIRNGYPAKASSAREYGPMVLSIVRDFAESQKLRTLQQLQSAFPHKGAGESLRKREGEPLSQFPHFVVDIEHPDVQANLEKVKSGGKKRFFLNEDQKILLRGGTVAVVTNQLASALKRYADNFYRRAQKLGYSIYGASKSAKHSPYWYVNTGYRKERSHRAWENCLNYGFISGGQDNDPGLPQSTTSQLKRIPLGAVVFAYQDGYLGYGVVTQAATPIQEFPVQDRDGETLAEFFRVGDLGDGFIPEREFAIRVDWLSNKPQKPRILVRHAYPNTASPIRDPERLRELKRVFGIVDESDDDD